MEEYACSSYNEFSARINVENFISTCRLECGRAGMVWASLRWPEVGFTKLGSPRVGRGKPAAENNLDPQFKEFAKAYLWHKKFRDPRFNVAHSYLGLRAIEAALMRLKGEGAIWQCNVQVLDEAVQLLRQHYVVGGTCYQISSKLELLGKFLFDNQLTPFSIHGWKNPTRKPDVKRTKIGSEAERYRQSKLPDDAALDAIAEVFAGNSELPRDILTTSFMAMAMCAPSRGNEILALPVWAEYSEQDRNGVVQYGWRFFSAKGGEGDIKWIPATMAGIGKTAFQRVRALTEPGRKLAKWIEDFPNRFYRHPKCPAVPEDQPLTMIEAALALGMNPRDRQQAATALHYRGLPSRDGKNSLASLWQHSLERLPSSFPWLDKDKKIKFSEALFCILRNQAHGSRASMPIELQILPVNFFTFDLSPRPNVKGHQSIFDRHNYKGSSGQSMKVSTHQIRHLLNTLASRAGLSQEHIAKWSGRANILQNRAYDHVTDTDRLAKVESKFKASEAPEGVKLVQRSMLPVKEDEFLGIITPAMHVTEAGFCVHNFIIAPCLKYRDCNNCEEQVCIKGDSEKLERLKARLTRMESVLALALAGADEETIGADRWVAHHRVSISRIKQLISLLTNNDLPDGSLIRLAGDSYSHLQRAVSSRTALAKEVE
ncbi:hypothetical protein I9H06_24160 [Pseudomonas tremae]|uniref:hypothetical protein n=1 Tax=Pseudomonas syringae group TaxID=136849 RepID=UPI000731DB3A|nr:MULTISPECIES: hypothetical protein [Pseudomonas syringae group]KTC55829.1 hypothetical protein AO258_20980 [Pseudomonas syringae ICMP 19498]MCF5714115.1 integrase [Pseudomonas tremae]UQB31330.1 hypothetical protein I9H06_24160 [Pseudomonas tremae]